MNNLIQANNTVMTDLFHVALLLNHEGALCSIEGDLNSSLSYFRRSLEAMMSSSTTAHEAAPAKPSSSPMGIYHLEMPGQRDKNYSNGDAFIYRRPLVFQDSYLPDNEDGRAAFCGTVVMNMAICFHVMSQTVANKTRFSNKALQLYDSSINLFTKISDRHNMSGVIAVALNNKVSILFDRADYELCRQEREQLRWFMAQAEQSPMTPSILEKDDFQGILLNILLLKPPILAEAA